MIKEIWKEVPGYEGAYQVSNKGRVRSLDREVIHSSGGTFIKKGKLLKLCDAKPYHNVGLSGKKFRVHQLVAMAFLGHKPCGYKLVVDHIDGNCHNNNLNNLQVITNRENTSKDKRGGSSQYVGVCWNKTQRKWQAKFKINKKVLHLGTFDDELEAHHAYQKKLKEIQK